jgi:hypothetical protein
MRGCQEQTREGDLGGSLGHGWTGRPKADNILLVRKLLEFNSLSWNLFFWNSLSKRKLLSSKQMGPVKLGLKLMCSKKY